MYRNCIFCSADFGTNESIEAFPVGRQLAFDAWRGRLWAVCPDCARWNLAPIEERWEAVEQAEKQFRDARLRVQSENVGLAKLPDGTRLVRVGQAVPGELAAWRYGRQLIHRRKRYMVTAGVGTAAGVAAWGGLQALGVGFVGMWMGFQWVQRRWMQKVVHRVPAEHDPDQRGLVIRRWHVEGLRLVDAGADQIGLEIRDGHRKDPGAWRDRVNPDSNDLVVVSGDEARAALARVMVLVNKKGATTESLRHADRILNDAGSAERVLRDAAAGGARLGERAGRAAFHMRSVQYPARGGKSVLQGPAALALEMALHEEAERRALEGELAGLEAAWKEAEEIAAIADGLPGEALLHRTIGRILR